MTSLPLLITVKCYLHPLVHQIFNRFNSLVQWHELWTEIFNFQGINFTWTSKPTFVDLQFTVGFLKAPAVVGQQLSLELGQLDLGALLVAAVRLVVIFPLRVLLAVLALVLLAHLLLHVVPGGGVHLVVILVTLHIWWCTYIITNQT